MSTYHLHCYNPKTINGETEEQNEYEITYENHKHLVQTLPKAKGWRNQHVLQYCNFWLGPDPLKGLVLIQNHFKPQPNDIFLAAFMKCGTTWLKALMFTIANRHRYGFSDHPLLHTGPQSAFPFLDTHVFLDYPITNFDHLPPPRLFATHFPHTLLPSSITSSSSDCKLVYVCRDPKDALISKWHFMSKLRSKELKPLLFGDAYELFCDGISEYGPFWDHVLGYWKASQESPEKIWFVKYEDMKSKPVAEVRKLAAFMRMAFTAEEEEKGVVEEIVKLCSFENLKNLEVNKSGGGCQRFSANVVVENQEFFRKGEVGDWQNHLTEEMKQRIDSITEHKLKGSGLTLGLTKNKS